MRLFLLFGCVLAAPIYAQDRPNIKKKSAPGGHPGVDPRQVNVAIDRGLAYLKPHMESLGGGRDALELVLYTWLMGGGSLNDPCFKGAMGRLFHPELERTYNVSLQAMLLEELDRVKYQERICKCAQFLVDNQCSSGQWGYGEPTQYGAFPKGMPAADGARIKIATGAKPRTSSEVLGPRIKPPVRSRVPVTKRRDGNPGDNSNSQYAALGLRACYDAGILLPAEVIERAEKFLRGCQKPDENDIGSVVVTGAAKDPFGSAGWCYTDHAEHPTGYGSMTAGAAGALAIYDYIKDNDQGRKMSWKTDKEIRKGLGWMARHFSVKCNPGDQDNSGMDSRDAYLYYMYAVERLGTLYGTDWFGPHDWYREGALELVATQQADGSWDKDTLGPIPGTCWAILFLKRATRPLEYIVTPSGRRLELPTPDGEPIIVEPIDEKR